MGLFVMEVQVRYLQRDVNTPKMTKETKKQRYLQDISSFHFHAFFSMVKSMIFLNFEFFKGFFKDSKILLLFPITLLYILLLL